MVDSAEPNSPNSLNSDSFVWDENSQLFYHASSGFYHDPSAGWYYSSKDGLYYKFENGNYVLLDSAQGDNSEINPTEKLIQGEHLLLHNNENKSLFHRDQIEASPRDEHNAGNTESSGSHAPEHPPPPSEWLEATLIDLYLCNYSNSAVNAAEDATLNSEADEVDDNIPADGNNDMYELEEGEWIPEDHQGIPESNQGAADEAHQIWAISLEKIATVASWDEENWRAQYGQVVQSSEEAKPEIPLIDLWDWDLVKISRKDGKGYRARLIGRLMKKSARLHPSMPTGGGVLRTSPICEAHLDLVRVTTGQVYKLRSPSARFLASLSSYDSSNPTKDWGFPEVSVNRQVVSSIFSGSSDLKTSELSASNDLPFSPDQVVFSEKHQSHAYRDRAAERRALHGAFGVGPGQKSSVIVDTDLSSPPVFAFTEQAAAEALNMSFGAHSYARRMLENMGWKEGEALGKSQKGLIEPIQAEGNVGNAGLGWPQGRSKLHRNIMHLHQ